MMKDKKETWFVHVAHVKMQTAAVCHDFITICDEPEDKVNKPDAGKTRKLDRTQPLVNMRPSKL